MRLHWLLCLGLFNTLGLGSNSALAVPIVSVDANPSIFGVQSMLNVNQLDAFSVDITISGVAAGMPLNAFQFGLEFDPSVLSATGITSGSFLLAPSLVVQSIVGTMSVEFAQATLFPLGVVGDGILASITFDAIGPGVSALALNNVVLSAAFGLPILDGGINNALLTVLTVPEPATFALFGLGLMALLGLHWRTMSRHGSARGDATISGNIALENGGTGIFAGSGSTVTGNVANRNDGLGLRLDSSRIGYKDNVLTSNNGG